MGRIILIGVRILSPWVARFTIAAIQLMGVTLIAIFIGVPKSIERSVMHWTEMAHRAGIPTVYDAFLHYCYTVIALVLFVAGWVLLSHFTVWVVRWIL